MDLYDLLDGNLFVEFVNGKETTINVIRVIFNPDGEPMLLIDDKYDMYNWSTITRARRVR